MGDYSYSALWTYTKTLYNQAAGVPPSTESVVITTVWGSDSKITAAATYEQKGGEWVTAWIILDGTAETQYAVTTADLNPSTSSASAPISSVQPASPSSTATPVAAPTPSITTAESTVTIDHPTVTVSIVPTDTTSSAVSVASRPSTSVSQGVAAGIGIACVAVGAVLASCLLCLFFLIRRRRTSSSQPSTRKWHISEIFYSGLTSRGASGKRSRAASSTISVVKTSLPPPLPDTEIAGELLRLETSIMNHAHSYFNTGELVNPLEINQEYLAQLLGPQRPIQPDPMAQLLADPRSRTVAVRFVLAWCILQHTQCGGDPCRSLLPPEIAESLESMAVNGFDHEHQAVLLSHWRQLTALLMSSTYSVNSTSIILPTDPRRRNVDDLTEALDVVLAPLTSQNFDESRKQDMEALVARAAQYAWRLFSQPPIWTLRWEVDAEHGDLVVFPALLQTGDDQGRPHKVAPHFTEAVVVKLNET